MTFEEAWLKLAEKKPLLLDSDAQVEITNDNLKRLLEQFYEVGKTAGTNTTSPFDRIFGGPLWLVSGSLSCSRPNL